CAAAGSRTAVAFDIVTLIAFADHNDNSNTSIRNANTNSVNTNTNSLNTNTNSLNTNNADGANSALRCSAPGPSATHHPCARWREARFHFAVFDPSADH
ncbi:MAG TPA: hypothetical protein VH088_18630, partial [Terriglobales bacterium]|nr:hypothetical protein [Terriglobales bacterium]